MKKIVRLNENDIENLVKKIIKEEVIRDDMDRALRMAREGQSVVISADLYYRELNQHRDGFTGAHIVDGEVYSAIPKHYGPDQEYEDRIVTHKDKTELINKLRDTLNKLQ